MSLLEEAFFGAAWDESQHPRHEAGTEVGGQFRSLWHVSPVKNRESIREKGLIPNAEKRYTDSGPGVYTFGSRDEAWRFATTGERMYGDSDIWEVKNEGLELAVDPFFEDGHPMAERAVAQFHGEKPNAFVTQQAIPSESLTLHPNPWHPDPETEKRLVTNALGSWIASPQTMRIHMANEVQEIDPDEGPAAQLREEAAALLRAVQEGGTNTKRLYRGATSIDPGDLGIPQSWTESKAVARKFAGKDGQVFTLEPGTARGIRMDDYLESSMNNREKQWLIDPWSFTVTASGWDESEHPRWPTGHPLGGQFKPKDGVGVLPAEHVQRFRKLEKVDWPGHPAWITKDGRYALIGDDDEGDYRKEYQVVFDADGGLNSDLTRGEQKGWVNSLSEGQLMVNDLVEREDIEERTGGFPTRFEISYDDELQKLVIGKEITQVDWGTWSTDRQQVMNSIQQQVQAEADENYADVNRDKARHKVKVGQAQSFRYWADEHYANNMNSEYSYPNGQVVHITDPRWRAINDNWGNWTTEEMQWLNGEIRMHVADAESKVVEQIFDEEGRPTGERYKNTPSGMLSGDYSKEIGVSYAKERNEAKRLIDPIDKVYYTQIMGEETARYHYPELFETKAPKVKGVDPKSQGIPDVYLSEKGTFKPGYDAKLKSDLVASAMGWYPKEFKGGIVSKETTAEAVAEWRRLYPDQTVDHDGVAYTDAQLETIALNQTLEYPATLRTAINSEKRSRWRDSLLHRFDQAEAQRILEERGWTKFLRQKEDKFNIMEREPTRDQIVAREIAEKNWGDALKINGHQYSTIQDWTAAMAEFEPGVAAKLAERDVKVFFGPGPSTDQDDMHSIHNEKGGGWGNTHLDKVRGFYSPSSRTVVMGTAGRGGSANITAHEVGHAIGHVLQIDGSDRLYQFHKDLYPHLDRYFKQDRFQGGRGTKELWAEGVAVVMENRARKRRGLELTTNSGPFKWDVTGNPSLAPKVAEYYAWVDSALRRIDELPSAAFSNNKGPVAPDGWRWRKDAVLGINVLEPA